MVKIRLRRIGTKGRPFYRVVVAPSSAGRNGRFVEVIGTYDPVVKPAAINIKQDRALHWLMNGAQPSETTAVILNKVGVLDEYFKARPNAKKEYAFLDKRVGSISVTPTIEAPVEAPKKAKAAEPIAEQVAEAAEPVAEAPAEVETIDEAAPVEAEAAAEAEAPAAEEATS